MRRTIGRALAVLALGMTTLCQARPGPGDIPPDYLGRGPDGHELHVSDLRGKVVIVSFWASWCGYCRKELPVLAALQKLKGTTDLQVIGVNHDDEYDKYKDLRRRWKNLDVILTYDAPDDRIGKPYEVKGLPYMVMIGRDGRIAHVHTGYGEETLDTIMTEVDDLLAQPAPGASNATTASPASS
jgi:thiol-disulfide isomerase/thioredoxin